MPFLLSKMESFVVEELKRRENSVQLNATDPSALDQQLDFATGKTPWIKAQSNAYFTNEDAPKGGNSWPKKWVLFGGTLGKLNTADKYFDSVYETTLNRPLPGITTLTSTIKGTLGLIREVKFDFICHTLGQSEVMQYLYMTPGVGVLLEWGWSTRTSINQSIDLFSIGNLGPPSNESSPITTVSPRQTAPIAKRDTWLVEIIREKMKRSNGYYDAMYGLVADFSVEVQADGTFNCSSTIIGPSAMTADLTIKTPGNEENEAFIRYMDAYIEQTKAWWSSNTTQVIHRWDAVESDVIDYVSESDSSGVKKTPEEQQKEEEKVFLENAKNLYIRWDFFEEFINSYFGKAGAKIIDSGEGKTVCPVAVADYTVENPEERQKVLTPGGKIYDLWRSFNPNFMIIPGLPKSGWKNRAGEDEYLPTEIPFRIPNSSYVGNLFAVYVSYSAIKDAVRNGDNLRGALTTLLNQMNEAAGGVWDLTLSLNGNAFSTMRVVDMNCAYGATLEPETEERPYYAFKSHKKSSIVRNITIAMSIPTALKTTIAIGTNMNPGDGSPAGADNSKTGAIRSFSRGVVDRFRYHQLQNTKETSEEVKRKEDIKKTRGTGVKKRYYETLTGDEKNSLISALLLNKDSVKNMTQSMLIPLEAAVTIDGLSGFIWGNPFTIEYLPERYKGTSVFQIFNITSNVSSDMWETVLTGKMRILPTATIGGKRNAISEEPPTEIIYIEPTKEEQNRRVNPFR